MSKCFVIINPIFLSKPPGNRSSFVTLNRTIRMSFDLVNPFATNNTLSWWKVNYILGMSFIDSLQFSSHSLLPKMVKASLSIESRLMRRKNSRTNNEITKNDIRLCYPE
ncbi:hypothetical protein CsSME_00045758 [Camellia sinensis var. sinensis]